MNLLFRTIIILRIFIKMHDLLNFDFLIYKAFLFDISDNNDVQLKEK